MLFKWLHKEEFDKEHYCDEGQRIGKDSSDIEYLEVNINLKAHSVGATKQLDNEHDLPDQRNSRSGSGCEIRLQLRE